jgi:hypothetical protein
MTWADGSTSPLKEGILQIFITHKNLSPSVGFQPAVLGFNGRHHRGQQAVFIRSATV